MTLSQDFLIIICIIDIDELLFSAVRFQQIMAERLGDRDYDNFDYDEHNELKSKIGFCYFGMPLTESGYDEKQNKTIETMYEIICEQSSNLFAIYWWFSNY